MSKQPLFDPQTLALFSLGYMKWLDLIFLMAFVGNIVTAFFWLLFGTPTINHLIGCGIIGLMILMLWLIILVYRCMWFVLVYVVAEIKTLPSKAAQLAVAFTSGHVPQQ